MPPLTLWRSPHDAKEIGGLEARPADQSAVNIGNGEDLGCVLGLHGSAIENADVGFVRSAFAQGRANRRMHLLNFPRRRCTARPNRPYRLIGDSSIVAAELGREAFAKLHAHDIYGAPGEALGLGFAYANDGIKRGSLRSS